MELKELNLYYGKNRIVKSFGFINNIEEKTKSFLIWLAILHIDH